MELLRAELYGSLLTGALGEQNFPSVKTSKTTVLLMDLVNSTSGSAESGNTERTRGSSWLYLSWECNNGGSTNLVIPGGLGCLPLLCRIVSRNRLTIAFSLRGGISRYILWIFSSKFFIYPYTNVSLIEGIPAVRRSSGSELLRPSLYP